jgi:hypothetical protein
MHSRLRPVGLRPVGLRPGLRPVGVAVLLSLGLVLAGCSSDATGDAAPAPTTSPSATPDPSAGASADPSAGAGLGARARAAAKYSSYVAMGDSYTAAPLVPSTDTGDGCLRSSHNYPGLVAAALPSADFVDVSCSGADSTSLVGVQQTPADRSPRSSTH